MELRFKVSGMTCAACSARVEKVTGAVPGVDKVEVNLLAGTMQVETENADIAVLRYRPSIRLSRRPTAYYGC